MSAGVLALVAQEALTLAVGDAMRRVLSVRGTQAFADLMDELRLAHITPEEAAADDATASRMVSFFVAMSQGAARRNLRVLAQIIARRAAYPLEAEDDFVSWADVIGSLRREEVILLGTFHRQQSECLKGLNVDVQMEDDTVRHEAMLETNRRVKAELIGSTKVFKHELTFLADATAATRTGLLIEYPVIDGMHFQATARMRELAAMIRVDEWAADALSGGAKNV